MKILNLYAGIGGNRKHWDGEKHDITSVEIKEEIAEVYRDNFAKDTVVVGDAHEYLKENYKDYDFIWASPPCPSHSKARRELGVETGQVEAIYPDMKLWQEIIFLKSHFEGDWVVENVQTYYDPLIKPQKTQRHYFWSNYVIPKVEVDKDNIRKGKIEEWEKRFGFDLDFYSFETVNKRKVLRNCVHPKIGKEILQARKTKQESVVSFGETDNV